MSKSSLRDKRYHKVATTNQGQKGGLLIVTPKQPDEMHIPLPLQAIALAKLSPDCISPSLIRSIEQWSTVTALPIIVNALTQVSTCDNAPGEFRQAMLNSISSGTPLTPEQPPVHKQTPPLPDPVAREPSPAVKQALRAQQRLIAMSDAEYQDEIVQRIKSKQ